MSLVLERQHFSLESTITQIRQGERRIKVIKEELCPVVVEYQGFPVVYESTEQKKLADLRYLCDCLTGSENYSRKRIESNDLIGDFAVHVYYVKREDGLFDMYSNRALKVTFDGMKFTILLDLEVITVPAEVVFHAA